jgi:hypothetical protein
MRFCILDYTGHTTMEFDTATKKGVSDAMEAFAELVDKQRKVAAVRRGEGRQEHIRSFDPNAEEVIFHSPLVGG